MNWPISTIGEVCEVISGATPKTGHPELWDGAIPWVTPKDLSDLNHKYLTDTHRKITVSGFKSCSAKMLPPKSVLFSSRAPIGLVAINTIPVCTNQGFKSMVPRNGLIDADFLYWWLKINRNNLEQKGRGATFKEVSKKIVEEIEIPLPPLPEQKRIAAILDAADAMRTKRRESLRQLDLLLQSTFHDMFGDPVTNTKGWTISAIGSHVKVIGGFAFKSTDFREHGLPVIRISNLNNDSIKLDDCARIPTELLGKGIKFRLHPGDTLIAMSGATTGKLGFVPDDLNKEWYLNQRVGCFRISSSSLDREYLRAVLQSKFYHDHIWSLAGGAAQPNISAKQLESAKIAIPPISLQQHYSKIVKNVVRQKNLLKNHLAELDTLFASLQHRAFNGEL